MEVCSKPVLPFMEASSSGNRSSLADDRLVWKLSDSLSVMPPSSNSPIPALGSPGRSTSASTLIDLLHPGSAPLGPWTNSTPCAPCYDRCWQALCRPTPCPMRYSEGHLS